MAKTIVVVNRHRVNRNKRGIASDWEGYDPPSPLPVFSVRAGKHGRPSYPEASRVYIGAPSYLVYNPDNPLPCGATCWIETEDDVRARYP